MIEYVWVSKLGGQEISPRFETAEAAGEWRQGSEAQRAMTDSLLGVKLRAINDGNWTRDATGAERLLAGVI